RGLARRPDLPENGPERAEPAADLPDPGLAGGHPADDDVVDPHLQGALGDEADVEIGAIAGVEVEPVELPALADAGDLDARLVPRDRAAIRAQPQVAIVIHALHLRPEPHVVAGARVDADPLRERRVDLGLLVAAMLDEKREPSAGAVLGRIGAPVGDRELPRLRVPRGEILMQTRRATIGRKVLEPAGAP